MTSRRSAALLAGCAAWALVAGAGCGSWQGIRSPAQLRAELAPRLHALPAVEIVVPHEVDADAIERAREVVGGHATISQRAQVLFDAIFADGVFGMRYTPIVTIPAGEALERHEGNCLTLASIFVGLARGVGLSAYYLDASKRVGEVDTEEEVIVHMGHITAAVESERGTLAMDFGWDLPRGDYYRRLDDDEAVAHFYNNRGYERLDQSIRAGTELDWSGAALDFAIATEIRPDFARGWNNLGIANARLGRRLDAIHDYRRAAELDADFAAPRTNLGVLALREGRTAEALAAFDSAVAIEPKNARAHFHRGVALTRLARPGEAIAAFDRALAIDPTFARAAVMRERTRADLAGASAPAAR
ncbi:MAG: tetratricopeptide repeat protein [Deltaproteobacteria bacterium]|nr:tetratricopeptide repeat protein [Deltaproteobacteria bacterium]